VEPIGTIGEPAICGGLAERKKRDGRREAPERDDGK
jgi:hypothetical protein